MDIQKQAEKYLEQFETIERGEENIVTLKDNCDQELKDSVYEAHGDRLPSDWIFDTYRSILSTIGDYDVATIEDLED